MSNVLTTLRTCAYCPNICRPSYSQQAELQIESQTPSALSLLALAVLDHHLPDDASTRMVLNRRAAAEASRGNCAYGFDIPAVLDATVGPPSDDRR
jgi:hypothetical protein